MTRLSLKPIVFLFFLALLPACATPRNTVFYQYNELEGVKSKTLDRLKWENTMQPDENISKNLILQTDFSSTHLIRIRGSEKRHVHEFHDSTVFFQSGTGRMYLGKSSFNVGPGAVIFIPHGVEHYFVNGGNEPATAIAVFSPSFDGQDVKVKE